jgi:hypothetical protein
MPLVVKMNDLDQKDFMIRCRINDTSASAVVRELIKQWMSNHPEMQKTRQKLAVD